MSYRFKFQIVDETTDEVVESDFCALLHIDEFGGCESVDIHVASMLRGFRRRSQREYEARDDVHIAAHRARLQAAE